MGARGPVPAPHALKVMRKTQPSRMGPDTSITAAEAKRQLLPTTPPKHLRDEAAECWKYITATQVKMVEGGRQPLIGKSERMLLEVACVNYRQWRRALRLFDENLDRLERKAKEEGVDPKVAQRRVMITPKRRGKGSPGGGGLDRPDASRTDRGPGAEVVPVPRPPPADADDDLAT